MTENAGAAGAKKLPDFQRHTPDWKALLAKVAAHREANGDTDWGDGVVYVADGACGTLEDIIHFQHPTVIIASRQSVIGDEIIASLTRNVAGHTNLVIVGAPGVRTAILAIMGNEVTIKKGAQVPLVFGAAQKAYADVITFLIALGVLPQDPEVQAGLVMYVQCYVDERATEHERVYDNGIAAVANAVVCAITGGPTQAEALAIVPQQHPFCPVDPQKLPEGLEPLGVAKEPSGE